MESVSSTVLFAAAYTRCGSVGSTATDQITELVGPWQNNGDGGWHAFFAQDQWTHNHLTLQGALRFDRSLTRALPARGGCDVRRDRHRSRLAPNQIDIVESLRVAGFDVRKDIPLIVNTSRP